MFTIQPSGNPNTNGRGQALRIGHTQTDNVSLLLDEYNQFGPGITLSLIKDAGRFDAVDTDDGCALRIHGFEYDVTIVFPFGLSSLRTELDMATDERVKPPPPTADERERAGLDPGCRFGSDIDAPFREDYEPSPYDGTADEY